MKILVPTDFSECATHATQMAISLGKRLREKAPVELHLVHLRDMPTDWIALAEAERQKMYPDITAKIKVIEGKLNGLVREVESEGLIARQLIHYHYSHKFLHEYIRETGCDLVVMGSHGASGITEFFIGTNTQRVVRNATVPVLVVKHYDSQITFDEIVMASNFDADTLDGFKKVVALARLLDARIHLLYVNTPASFMESPEIELRMRRYDDAGKDIIEKRMVFNAYDFEEGLSKVAKKHGNMLAMVTHGTKGSLTERVINHVTMPVLSVHY